MSTALVVSLNQAAINGIRAAGAKQVINVEGNGKCGIAAMIMSYTLAVISNWGEASWCLPSIVCFAR